MSAIKIFFFSHRKHDYTSKPRKNNDVLLYTAIYIHILCSKKYTKIPKPKPEKITRVLAALEALMLAITAKTENIPTMGHVDKDQHTNGLLT